MRSDPGPSSGMMLASVLALMAALILTLTAFQLAWWGTERSDIEQLLILGTLLPAAAALAVVGRRGLLPEPSRWKGLGWSMGGLGFLTLGAWALELAVMWVPPATWALGALGLFNLGAGVIALRKGWALSRKASGAGPDLT